VKNETEPIIGYQLSLPYNNTIMDEQQKQITPLCPNCGYVLNDFQHRPEYNTKQRLPGLTPHRYDIASTLDHRIIVSREFRDFCEQSGYDGLEYFGLNNDLLHFQLGLTRILYLDRCRSEIEFGELCPLCHRYDAIGAGRKSYTVWGSKSGSLVFKLSEPILDGFFRTDLSFGHANKWSPEIIIGIETRVKLKKAGLTGIHTCPAFGVEPGSEPICPQNSAVESPADLVVRPKLRQKRRKPN
jgi:hypothetical protein